MTPADAPHHPEPPEPSEPDAWGLQVDWIDADDQPQRVSESTVTRLREAIGQAPADLDRTAPVVTRPGRSTGLRGSVTCEDGSERDLDDVVPDDFPLGYHRITVEGRERSLIVSPGRCWLPPTQRWGWSVQLYAAWSRRGAGIGDLRDLRTLREWTQATGGGFLLVNPLHAVAPRLPMESSPYLPATRRFRNPVYLALDDVPGAESALARSAEPDSARRPEPGVIDRDAAWAYKLGALRTLWDTGLDPESATAFAEFRSESGQSLDDFAVWCVLVEEHGPDWREWPDALRDPHGEAAAAVGRDRVEEVGFWAWLQWLLAEQLATATGDLTVIQDLPIGVSGGGADAWVWQDVMAHGVTVGAPADALNTVGQDWGSPPLVPWRLRAADYVPFIESVRATIAGAGGLRIDHVMGLFRLWWIPDGERSTEGCYVRYPADDLLDIVCLESHRAQAVVVGEDLGIVEDGVPEALTERNILSYQVLWFEAGDPAQWKQGALATVTTHDLPTVAGVWSGSDVDDAVASSDMDPADVAAGNQRLREVLLAAGTPSGASAEVAVAAAYARLGRAPSLLLAAALEDAVSEERRPNVPGTTERDNWRVPLPMPLEDLLDDPRPAKLVEALRGGHEARQPRPGG